jgi:hypothetical protein
MKALNFISATNGYKTKITAIIYLLVTIFGDKVSFISDNEQVITTSIDILMASGLLHDFWRNKDKIWEWIKDIVKKNK